VTASPHRRALPERVVCNTGPVLALSRVSRLDLLATVFPALVVPTAVRDELRMGLTASESRLAEWLQQVSVQEPGSLPDVFLAAELDAGEAAVITLARESGAGVVMDERKGRRIAAMAYGLHVVGTGRILLEAKERGLVNHVKPLVEEMHAAGYFLSERIKQHLLREAGEA
jgi:uncharacterized protein